jgi:hypothetical protein
MVFAFVNKKEVIMKVIVSFLLVIATIIALWGAGSMVDITVFMIHSLQ